MRKMLLRYMVVLVPVILGLVTIFTFNRTERSNPYEKVRSTSSPKSTKQSKKGRIEYIFNMLRDPATNRIPKNIRRKELAFAKTLPSVVSRLNKKGSSTMYDWIEVGPNDVGGRTRALAVDLTDSNVLLAGGVSGGIWKSIDGGSSWNLKNLTTQHLSVTSIAQDPISTDIWYYSTGEFDGNSASDISQAAYFFGEGLFKSTDRGETWNPVPSAADDPTMWDNLFDLVSRVAVSPTTGTVFIASHAFGIYRSTDGGDSFSNSFGAFNDHDYLDLAIGSDGRIVVVASSGVNESPTNPPGVYLSLDDGDTWSIVTPTEFPDEAFRSVIAISPSNPFLAWVLTNTGLVDEGGREDVRFYQINTNNGNAIDQTSNLPNFNNSTGSINTQGSYNMVIGIKPDDAFSVYLGGTSLFRSSDGFNTLSVDTFQTWIGGYYPDGLFNPYPEQHPDQHVITFSSSNPNTMWVGHDGGISKVEDVTAVTSKASLMEWVDMNNGYNVTQFYEVSISKGAGDERIMGGTQDNGTPYFRWNGTQSTASDDKSSGDGAYSYFGDNFAYVSTQNGKVLRINYDASGNPNNAFNPGPGTTWSFITPTGAEGQLFINPYEVDPNNENVMYYPSGGDMWRNDQLESIPNSENGTSVGWQKLTNLTVPTDYVITALVVSQNNPQHLLYYGAYHPLGSPLLFKLTNSETATGAATDISIPTLPIGSYTHNISVNPQDGNEIIVTFSNYGIVGLYHSFDGGSSWNAIEGNLTGNVEQPGPSLRASTIIPILETTHYLLGTSIGVYSTKTLNGNSTIWELEGASNIGNVVVGDITSRISDGRVIIGTHGRGIFLGDLSTIGIVRESITISDRFSLEINYPNPFNAGTSIGYRLPEQTNISLIIYNLQGQEIMRWDEQNVQPGYYSKSWNGTNKFGVPVGSGVYLYRLVAREFVETRKMMLLK